MNRTTNIISVSLCALALCSCLKDEKFVQEIFVYEPHGNQYTIEQIKALPSDQAISEDIYVQGVITSSDISGNYSQKLFFQDNTSGLSVLADLGSSNQLFPIGQKVSIQVKDMVLADVNGVLCLASRVSGEGLSKKADPIGNRVIRNSMFAIEGGALVTPKKVTLAELSSGKGNADCLVVADEVFFQTNKLPFANDGGSSEQYRTLFEESGASALLCTSDGSDMAALSLPKGKGSVTAIVTYPGGTPVLMVRSKNDFNFTSSEDVTVDDPEDVKSSVLISEVYSKGDAHYIEVFNVGTTSIDLSTYTLRSDSQSNGEFSNSVSLGNEVLAPFGMVVYSDAKAREELGFQVSAKWEPCRTNYSGVDISALALDGNNQLALYDGETRVDLLATTNKGGWAANKTLIRRQGICGHSKANDYTRADAGWITKIAGYAYNVGVHRYFDSDPDFDSPLPTTKKSILELKSMFTGTLSTAVNITGYVISDREGGNVPANCVYIQDDSNRGIKILFREGQSHDYNVGEEISLDVYGAVYESVEGLLQLRDCFVARSWKTEGPVREIEPIDASISQISNLQSMYISVSGVQADGSSLGGNYTEEGVLYQDLFANSFFVQARAGSALSSTAVASNSGTVCGIASVVGEKLVILPRNVKDLVKLTEARFEPIVAEPIAVSALKKYSAGTISDNVRVTVNVISDNSEGNMGGDVVFVQDESGAFRIKLASENSYQFGQPLIVVLKGATLDTSDGYVVTPASASSVVAIGSPDPSIQATAISHSQLDSYLDMLVTISDVQVDESCRLNKFEGTLLFNTKSASKNINVKTASSATWFGSYVPTATGSITGLLCKESGEYCLYPRKAADLAGLPESGKRLDGESVVYFVPSTDPKADLFISETVFGELDANGAALASTARNKCNSKFVELYNPTGASLDLHNYRVACIKYNNSVARSTIQYYQFPEGVMLTPGRTAVFKYLSVALGSSTTSKQTNTIWPKNYTGDADVKEGVVVDQTSVPGVILFLDARDYAKTVANSVAAFPSFDGNDILVVQKTADGGATWTEIDRVFVLVTNDGAFGTTKAVYPFMQGYMRKPGALGVVGNVTDVQDAAYAALDLKQNHNDFESTQCSPTSEQGVANWVPMGLLNIDDLGVHQFSVKQ